MVDKNLFLYDLAIAAIFKDEGRYLKEWLDYHLAAGVDHFYLYNNDSSDDYQEVLVPYVEKNLVTLTECPGKLMQYPAYEDALEKYRFECRYMAFIDIDEFIYPKVNWGGGISEVVDEILCGVPNAAGLAINWQIFGSNGQETADYSRGVLERFTRRAPSGWVDWNYSTGFRGVNDYIKTIENPRLISYRNSPHFSHYFDGQFAVQSDGKYVPPREGGMPVLTDKIVVNHYYIKSREEYEKTKMQRGWSCPGDAPYGERHFETYDRNEEFDDGILKYRAAREKIFSPESNEERIRRVERALIETLTQYTLSTAPEDFFVDKLETFLTCRAAAEKLGIIVNDVAMEEIALAWIYTTLVRSASIGYVEIQQFMKALPEILTRPFPICKQIQDLIQSNILPSLCEALKNGDPHKSNDKWKDRSEWLYIQKLLRLIK